MFLWPVSEPPRNEKSPFFTFYLLNSTLQKVVQKTEQKKALCDVTNGPDTSPRLMTTPAATVFIPWFEHAMFLIPLANTQKVMFLLGGCKQRDK